MSDPSHYPVYLKDSVINTNLEFDYGAFVELETEVKLKKLKGL